MRRAARTDSNQSAIVTGLRKLGCRVLSLAAIGNGCPDLLVYRHSTDELFMLEVKSDQQPPSKQKLTPHQIKFHEEWPVRHDVKTTTGCTHVLDRGPTGTQSPLDVPWSRAMPIDARPEWGG